MYRVLGGKPGFERKFRSLFWLKLAQAMSSKRRATPRHVRTHAWELEEANWVDSDSDFDGPQWDSESDDDNMDNLSPREGLQHFVSLMLSLYMEGTLSARVVCVLFHWVSTFFSDAEIRKYAKKPGLPSGHYAQHLDKESGLTESRSQHYTVKMPGHRRHDLSRTVHDIPVRVGHEELDEEVKADPSIAFRLAELVHDRSLPPSYYTHPVVQESPGLVLPTALYVDAVP